MKLSGVAKGEELAAAVTRIADGSAVILLVAESRKVLDFMNRLINPLLGESPPVGLVNRGVTRRTLSATDNSRFDHANPASPPSVAYRRRQRLLWTTQSWESV
jgi:hypothetical protein